MVNGWLRGVLIMKRDDGINQLQTVPLEMCAMEVL